MIRVYLVFPLSMTGKSIFATYILLFGILFQKSNQNHFRRTFNTQHNNICAKIIYELKIMFKIDIYLAFKDIP